MKKAFITFFTFLLLVTAGTTKVLADGEVCYVNGPGTSNTDVGKGTIALALAETHTGENLSSPTTIKLNSDIQEDITIASGRYIVLDLNGYVLSGSGLSSVITNKGILKIIDSNPNNTHNFKVNSDGLWSITNETSTTTLESLTNMPTANTVIEVKGGCITGGIGTDVKDIRKGGCIYNTKDLTITSGNIVGNKANSGGAVYSSTNNGISMTGGNILGNIADNGGGIYATKGSVNISNGNVAYNKITKTAPAIYISSAASFDFSGSAKLFYNTTTSSTAGCVCISTTGDVNFSGGVIENNTGGVNISSKEANTAKITFSGKPVIQNNTSSAGLTQNVFVGTGKLFNISSPETDMKIGITLQTTTNTFVTGLSEDYSTYLVSDDIGFVIKYDSGNISLQNAPKIDIGSQADVDEALKSRSNDQVWNITKDFEIDNTILLSGKTLYSVTINGNNHTIAGKTGTNSLTHLISIGVYNTDTYLQKVVTINDLTLKCSNQFINCIFINDKVGRGKTTLNNVTLDHSIANDETGVPLLNNWSHVTVTNNLNIITGKNSWHAINMDALGGTSTLVFSEEAGKEANVTITDNRTVEQKAKEPQIKLDNYYTVSQTNKSKYPQENETKVIGMAACGFETITDSNTPANTLGFSVTANVVYDTEGGSSVDPEKVAIGQKLTKPADPSKEGKIFNGWYKDSSLKKPWNFDKDVVEEDTILYARWKRPVDLSYKVVDTSTK